MGSALLLAQMTGNSSFIEKLNKLSLLGLPNLDITEENSPLMNSENLLIQQEDFIRQAAEKLDLVKLRRMKGKIVKTTDGDVGNNKRWVIAKSWNPCPIGMLPRILGSSGRLPVLECDDDRTKVVESSERKKPFELNRCGGKREASCDTELLDKSVKRMRETGDGYCASEGKEDMLFEGVEGRLMIGGFWKKVGEEDLLAIKSAIRIFV
ncbi:hypothetical protein L1049_018045 [Liquidambar formosana]|uniref:Uncharacterized protein n=1 Tax=Liquidambar formosana TaxID=63359 RepID=A0AAP0R9K6_LIQFO